jgi:uncharacterized protein YuzE
MKIFYDKEVDALYLQLSEIEPDGVMELSEGINLDTSCNGKILGIEILGASKKLNLETILNYSIDHEALKNLV